MPPPIRLALAQRLVEPGRIDANLVRAEDRVREAVGPDGEPIAQAPYGENADTLLVVEITPK